MQISQHWLPIIRLHGEQKVTYKYKSKGSISCELDIFSEGLNTKDLFWPTKLGINMLSLFVVGHMSKYVNIFQRSCY